MVEAVNLRRAVIMPLLLIAMLAIASPVCAISWMQYLQATLVDIEPECIRLQINLTPGVSVADAVLSLIDRDRDGKISATEAAAYSELLKRDLIVRLDQRIVELKPTSFNFPDPDEVRTGWGIIQIEYSIDPGSMSAGDTISLLENHHLNTVSAYLFNAALPRSDFIEIASQKRNESQSIGDIEFTFHPPAKSSRHAGTFASVAVLLAVGVTGMWRVRRNSPRVTEV